MKKKWTDNRPYYYSKDAGIDDLAMKIVEHLKEVDNQANTTRIENLELAAISYLENNLTNDKLMVFTRPITLGHHESEEERVRHWLNEAIKAILDTINCKEKRRWIKILNETNNGKGITLYKDHTDTLLLKGILSPHTISISSSEYTKMDEMIKDRFGISIKDMDYQQFYRLQSDMRFNSKEFKQLLRTLSFEVYPDDMGKVIDRQEAEKNLFPQFQRMIQERGERERVKKMSSTMSVFDGIE